MTSLSWNQFAFVYSNVGDTEKCEVMKSDIQVTLILCIFSIHQMDIYTNLSVPT
ncbi:unnamed protein product [Haemonchus placei]|uniref:Uncharacterized protein n=1 Tax=Haemonchus placei TaxID=6290 RepID=A0A0N4WSH6_HAEPC|nr:unnamed protein product [Haemonchus placei]